MALTGRSHFFLSYVRMDQSSFAIVLKLSKYFPFFLTLEKHVNQDKYWNNMVNIKIQLFNRLVLWVKKNTVYIYVCFRFSPTYPMIWTVCLKPLRFGSKLPKY